MCCMLGTSLADQSAAQDIYHMMSALWNEICEASARCREMRAEGKVKGE